MQAGTAIPAQGNEVASIRKQVRRKKKTAEAESPDWFPKGLKTEIKYRGSGPTAGSTDKYYVEEATGYRFRSKREVKSYLESGKKPKPKSKLLGSVKDEASAAPPSTNSLIFRTPDLNAPPQREAELEHVKALTKSKQQRPASGNTFTVIEVAIYYYFLIINDGSETVMVRLLAPFHVAKTIGRGVKSGEVGRGRDDSSGVESGTFWTVAASSQQTSRGATLSLLNKGANPSNGCSRDRKKNKIGSVFSTPHRTLFRSDSRFAESTMIFALP